MGSQVAVIKGTDPPQMVRQALELIGGITSVVGTGDKVLIKPNLVSPPPDGLDPKDIATDIRVIVPLVELCREAGASEVWVGDGPGTNMKARRVFKVLGVEEPVRKAGGSLAYFDELPHVTLPVPEGRSIDKVKVPRLVAEADVFINLPKMKTNGMGGGVSLGLKNLFGVPPYYDRLPWHKWPLIFSVMCDLSKAIRSSLVLVDGIVAMEGRGPINGIPKEMNLVVAGKNVVSTDAVTAAVMGFEPAEIPVIPIAEREGLGCGTLSEIEVVGAPIAEVAQPFRRAIPTPVHPSKNVTVIPGGGCVGCSIWIPLVPPPFKIDPTRKYALLLGRLPKVPEPGDFDEVWVLGKCASPSLKQIRRKGLTHQYVEGCPPYKWIAEKVAIPAREVLLKKRETELTKN